MARIRARYREVIQVLPPGDLRSARIG
jgi:hypothetical protein